MSGGTFVFFELTLEIFLFVISIILLGVKLIHFILPFRRIYVTLNHDHEFIRRLSKLKDNLFWWLPGTYLSLTILIGIDKVSLLEFTPVFT